MSIFDIKKTLILVYKDELLMNQLKKLIETHDDNTEGVVGTKDDSINVISWSEKVWLGNKKAGNINEKILFLDKIKGTDKLIPVLDIKFDECGVKYGRAGNQSVLYVEPQELIERKDYDAFLKKLSELPVPDFLKSTKENVTTTGLIIPEIKNLVNVEKETGKNKMKVKLPDFLKPVGEVISTGADAIGKINDQIVAKSEEIFRNKDLMKQQMLFYGVVRLYNDYLEQFMDQ